MFSLLVEYGLIHRGDCINCETCYFCFDPAFVWPSLRLSRGLGDVYKRQIISRVKVCAPKTRPYKSRIKTEITCLTVYTITPMH